MIKRKGHAVECERRPSPPSVCLGMWFEWLSSFTKVVLLDEAASDSAIVKRERDRIVGSSLAPQGV